MAPTSKFTQPEIEQYYRIRLDSFGVHHEKGSWHRSRCPVHGGDNPNSLAVNFEEGNYFCFACQAKGGSIFAFEQELLRKASAEGQAPEAARVLTAIHELMGTPFTHRTYSEPLQDKSAFGWDRSRARDYYRYTDELGRELFTVWRFVDTDGKKITPSDHPCACSKNPDAECEEGCKGGRVWGSKGCRRVIYRLPDVMQSILCFVVEGEKNANDLSRALVSYISKHKGLALGDLVLDHVAVTTNPGGSSGWKEQFAFGKYFIGKVVIKLGDNDVPGAIHTKEVCADISRFAAQLFTLDLPVGEGEDISDYLARNSIDQFLELLPQRKTWIVAQQKETRLTDTMAPRVLLVEPTRLVTGNDHSGGDWLVEGLIERGTRGLLVARPKAGKSLLNLDLSVAFASMQSFLGSKPYSRPIKTAIISREDGPTLIHRRLSQLARGRGLHIEDLDKYLLVNTVKQSASFHIDIQRELDEMAEWLKAAAVEFCVLDVLNRLHGESENSSDMTKIMLKFDDLAQKSGAQICVIHHLGHSGDVKGNTSIEGWADYLCRLEVDAKDESLKTLTLKTKSSGTVKPRQLQYWQSPDMSMSRIKLVTTEPKLNGTTQQQLASNWYDRDSVN